MKENKISILSKKSIVDSLFDLLYVKSFEEITVSEIAENADLDRRTFYRHFKSKEEVLSCYVQEKAKQYEQRMAASKFDIQTALKEIFCIFEENKEILTLFYRRNLLHILLYNLNTAFQKYEYINIVNEKLQPEHRAYKSAYHSGGLGNLLTVWLSEGCERSPCQMSEILCKILEESKMIKSD